MKRFEFLRGWNKGGSVEFVNGISVLKDSEGEIIKGFRQIVVAEVENWLSICFCKEVTI